MTGEQQLMVKAKRGDREAMRQLIDCHYASVYRFLTSLCGTSQEAEELTQESILKALLRIRGFREQASFRTWLHAIAYRQFLNWRRQRKPFEDLTEALRAPQGDTETLLVLQSAMQCLSPDHRSAFWLCDVEEMTMDEAAVILDAPVGTVKSRLHHARRALRKELEGHQGESTYESSRR